MGVSRYKGATGVQLEMKREMFIQLRADGFIVNSIVVKEYDDFYLDIDRN
jgi:hypothetical protein